MCFKVKGCLEEENKSGMLYTFFLSSELPALISYFSFKKKEYTYASKKE
jgi:hypothetical protein